MRSLRFMSMMVEHKIAMIDVVMRSAWLMPSTLPNRMWSRCTSVSIFVSRTRPSANMPENTMPMTASSFMRLFSFMMPVAMAQNSPATNAPIIRGMLSTNAIAIPGKTA